MDEGVIKAVGELFQQIVTVYGPGWTAFFVFLVLAAAATWKVYQDRRKDKEVNLALEEKERTIARLASENATYRVEALVQKGWSREEALSLVRTGAVAPSSAKAPKPSESTYLPKTASTATTRSTTTQARKKS